MVMRVHASPFDLCLYHDNCIDGFTAAWVAQSVYPGIECVGVNYGDKAPPPGVAGRRVLILDFAYPREQLEAMNAAADALLVLDHHATHRDALYGLPYAVFDMHRSGAGLAWDYLCAGTPRPLLVDLVEDRDLWRWALPDSKTLNAAIHSWPMTFAAWTELNLTPRKKLLEVGAHVEMHINHYVAEMLKNAYEGTLPGFGLVMTVNAAYPNISELLGALTARDARGVAVGWWRRPDGQYSISLRSSGGTDVAEIARSMGGGGHIGAAGAVLPELPEGLR